MHLALCPLQENERLQKELVEADERKQRHEEQLRKKEEEIEGLHEELNSSKMHARWLEKQRKEKLKLYR